MLVRSGKMWGFFPLSDNFPSFPRRIRMKTTLAILAAGVLVAGAAQAQDLTALMQKNGCVACHAVDKKIVGPAYQEVAAKYKGDAGAAAKLATKIKAGGTGVWGQVPMPPNPQVSDADIKTMVAAILAIKPAAAAPAAAPAKK
jgi:cytochrome c